MYEHCISDLISDGGRLHDELNFLESVRARTQKLAVDGVDDDNYDGASVAPEGGDFTVGVQVVISTPRKQGLDILTREDLLLHAEVLTNISSMTVTVHNE